MQCAFSHGVIDDFFQVSKVNQGVGINTILE